MEAGVLADVVGGHVTANVVPEVVPEDGDEGVVDLHHAQAHLPAVVVGLPVSPVKPTNLKLIFVFHLIFIFIYFSAHCLIGVVPDPLAGRVLAVTLLKYGNLKHVFNIKLWKPLDSLLQPNHCNCFVMKYTD